MDVSIVKIAVTRTVRRFRMKALVDCFMFVIAMLVITVCVVIISPYLIGKILYAIFQQSRDIS